MTKFTYILLITLLVFSFHSCHKENGRHKYQLTLNFDNYSDNATFEYYVFEKVKNYKQSWAPSKKDLYSNKGCVILSNEDELPLFFDLYNGGVKSGVWTGVNYFEFDDQKFPDNSIPVNANNRFIGQLYASFSFTKDGREIRTSESTFTFIWQNHDAFGHTDSIFHGKFSLLRI